MQDGINTFSSLRFDTSRAELPETPTSGKIVIVESEFIMHMLVPNLVYYEAASNVGLQRKSKIVLFLYLAGIELIHTYL